MTSHVLRYFSLFLNGLLRGLLRAWLLVLPLVLVLSLIRWAQIFYFWPQGFGAEPADVLAVAFQGFRFDLKVSAVAGFVLLLVLPWASDRLYRRMVALLAFVFVLLSIINLHYFSFYKTPMDSLVFGLVEDDPAAVLGTIWQDFPVAGSLAVVALLGWATVWLHQRIYLLTTPVLALQRHSIGVRVVCAVLASVALLLAGKGTLREMALQRQHLSVTTSQFLNDMVPNGVIALKYTWDSRDQSQNLNDPLVGLKAVGFASASEAAQVLGLPHGNDEQIKVALTARASLPLEGHSGSRKRNLLFFLMESWSAEPMRYHSPQFDVLGRLAPTLDKACHFSNFDSAHSGTHPSMEAILYSSPITPLTLGEVWRKPIPWSIAKVARDAGYQTLFLTSGRSGWRDLNRVLPVQGFDEIVDANTLKQLYPQASLGLWGVWDAYLFHYLRKRMAEPGSKPLFVFVLSSTNHPPYDLPSDYQRVPRDMQQWKGETSSDTLLPNLDSYHYATDQLGAFVHDMQSGPRKSDTIMAATGDHNVRSFGIYADPQRRYLIRQVPFVIWGDGLECGNQLQAPASHRDMFSTLLPLAGIEGPYINAGRNLLEPLTEAASPLNAARTLIYTGEARNAQGMWQLGNPASFVCTPTIPSQPSSQAAKHCAFNPQDDHQERARYALLDWNIRISLRKP
ncbi:MAG: LTA synthase family protein [Rhodoferax sp.]|nr:LTA synthase family protein [Rhodoferax sp.]